MRTDRTLIRAAMVVDGAGTLAAPGAVLLEGDRVVAAGSPESIGTPAGAAVEDRSHFVVLPPLVNAHAHLDLTHLGPQPRPDDFVEWVRLVRDGRAVETEAIARSVAAGAALARAGGTALVGDIAGAASTAAIEALRASGLGGVSFLEVFGLGQRQPAAIDAMRRAAGTVPDVADGVRLGLQPHAPYSCGPEVYRAAADLGMPLATHLAETLEEIRLLEHGDGPLLDFLEGLGACDATVRWPRCHPVDALADVLATRPVLAAHVNYVDDARLARLASWPLTVAYCPRASAYFGHPATGHAPHRYREMIDAGVPVALGTDSLLCLDTPDRISVLDDMRFIHRRDGTDAVMLLRMATTVGAEALGFEPGVVTLAPGPVAGLLALPVDPAKATDPLRQALERDDAPRWIVGPVDGARLAEASAGAGAGS